MKVVIRTVSSGKKSYRRVKNEKKNCLLLSLVVIMILTAFFIGCSKQQPSSPEPKSTGTNLSKVDLSIGTAPSGGVFYIIGAGIAELSVRKLRCR